MGGRSSPPSTAAVGPTPSITIRVKSREVPSRKSGKLMEKGIGSLELLQLARAVGQDDRRFSRFLCREVMWPTVCRGSYSGLSLA